MALFTVENSEHIDPLKTEFIEKGVILSLFKIFNETLDAAGVFANEGKMVDASFVKVPRQRNTREEPRSAHEYL